MTKKYAKLHHIDFMHVLFFRDIFQFKVKPRGNSFENNCKHPVEWGTKRRSPNGTSPLQYKVPALRR